MRERERSLPYSLQSVSDFMLLKVLGIFFQVSIANAAPMASPGQ